MICKRARAWPSARARRPAKPSTCHWTAEGTATPAGCACEGTRRGSSLRPPDHLRGQLSDRPRYRRHQSSMALGQAQDLRVTITEAPTVLLLTALLGGLQPQLLDRICSGCHHKKVGHQLPPMVVLATVPLQRDVACQTVAVALPTETQGGNGHQAPPIMEMQREGVHQPPRAAALLTVAILLTAMTHMVLLHEEGHLHLVLTVTPTEPTLIILHRQPLALAVSYTVVAPTLAQRQLLMVGVLRTTPMPTAPLQGELCRVVVVKMPMLLEQEGVRLPMELPPMAPGLAALRPMVVAASLTAPVLTVPQQVGARQSLVGTPPVAPALIMGLVHMVQQLVELVPRLTMLRPMAHRQDPMVVAGAWDIPSSRNSCFAFDSSSRSG